MITPQIANPKIFIQFCTTLSPTSSFKKDLLLFFTVNQSILCQICEEKKYAFSQIRKVPHLRKISANLTNYFRPQIYGFAFCGTYLRTAHLLLQLTQQKNSPGSNFNMCNCIRLICETGQVVSLSVFLLSVLHLPPNLNHAPTPAIFFMQCYSELLMGLGHEMELILSLK